MTKIVVVKDLGTSDQQKQRLERLGEVIYYQDPPKDGVEWLKRVNGYDIICSGVAGMRGEEIYELKNVFIVLPIVGYDFLDVERLKQRNILVSNAPGCNKEAVTEWIVGMLLSYARNLHNLINNQGIDGQKVFKNSPGVFGKNTLILGKGNIARSVGSILIALGMNINFCGRDDNLCEKSTNAEVIINCLPSNSSTHGMLDQEFFNCLENKPIIISVSRGDLFDYSELKKALNTGKIEAFLDDAGGINVGEVNAKEYKSLIEMENSYVTPHIAWNSKVEAIKSNDIMIDNIEAYLNGKPQNLIY